MLERGVLWAGVWACFGCWAAAERLDEEGEPPSPRPPPPPSNLGSFPALLQRLSALTHERDRLLEDNSAMREMILVISRQGDILPRALVTKLTMHSKLQEASTHRAPEHMDAQKCRSEIDRLTEELRSVHQACDSKVTQSTPTPTPAKPAHSFANTSVCWSSGDPHVSPFDVDKTTGGLGGSLWSSFEPAGFFWIVRSAPIWIQGHYASSSTSTPSRPMGAKTVSLGVSGDFVMFGRLVIFKEGTAYWNDGEVLSKAIGRMEISEPRIVGDWSDALETTARRPMDGEPGEERGPGMELRFPLDVRLTVLPINGVQLDFTITMKRPPGPMRGHCGNFNGNSSDDTLGDFTGLVDAVPPQDVVENKKGTFTPLSACEEQKRNEHEAKCRSDMTDSMEFYDEYVAMCAYRLCFFPNATVAHKVVAGLFGTGMTQSIGWTLLGMDRACFSDSLDSISNFFKVETPAGCKALCRGDSHCVGIQYNRKDSYCELWQKPINSTTQVEGRECWTYDRVVGKGAFLQLE